MGARRCAAACCPAITWHSPRSRSSSTRDAPSTDQPAAQGLAVDLADRRQRDGVDQADLTRVLVAADVLAGPDDQLLGGELGVRRQADERDDLLAVALAGTAD